LPRGRNTPHPCADAGAPSKVADAIPEHSAPCTDPGASLGAALNRQVISFRDADADGLADLMVTGGVNVAGDLQLMFDNRSITTYRNPFGTQGLLNRVYLAASAESSKPQPNPDKANYQFNYARSAATEDDPQNRWVLSEMIVRDGVPVDDAYGVHDRRTCFSYENSFYDRFERVFLGFSDVTTVEGCTTVFANRPKIQLNSSSQALLGSQPSAAAVRDSDQLAGIRRTDRTYARRQQLRVRL
jgi:Insecticide toxin TcdB middle/N-terminal region